MCLQAWLSPGIPYYVLFPPATGTQVPGAQWGLLTPQNLPPIPPGTCDHGPPHGTSQRRTRHMTAVFCSARAPLSSSA